MLLCTLVQTMNQVESIVQQAYKLNQDLDRMEDYAPEWREEWGVVDAKPIGELANKDSLDMVFYDPEPIDSFKEIRMQGFLSNFEGIDYLYTEPMLPIMSKRMLSVLESVGDFPHQIIPTAIEDTQSMAGADGKFRRSGKVNTDYVAVQLLEQLDIFDRENSIYEPGIFNPNDVGDIDKLVLKIPESGLPPIFRIANYSIVLYVSPEAKTALEEAGITGIRFVPID